MIQILTVYISDPAKSALQPREVFDALKRHERNEWGTADPELRENNELAIHRGGRVVSVLTCEQGLRYRVVSEGQRTTALITLESEADTPQRKKSTTRISVHA